MGVSQWAVELGPSPSVPWTALGLLSPENMALPATHPHMLQGYSYFIIQSCNNSRIISYSSENGDKTYNYCVVCCLPLDITSLNDISILTFLNLLSQDVERVCILANERLSPLNSPLKKKTEKKNI